MDYSNHPQYENHPNYGSVPFDADRTAAPMPEPVTVSVSWMAGLAAGLASILGGVILIARAHHLVEDAVGGLAAADETGLIKALVDDAAHTLIVRGWLTLVFGALVVGLVVLVRRRSGLGARIALALAVLCGIGVDYVAIRHSDEAPGVTKILDVLAILLSLVVVIALFLPATNQYAKARKQATA